MANPNPVSRKGIPNKKTAEIKNAFSKLLHENKDNIIEWLERVAVKDPARALELVAKFGDFTIPRLSRTTQVDDEGNVVPPIVIAMPTKKEEKQPIDTGSFSPEGK
jgi:hypothetical protein